MKKKEKPYRRKSHAKKRMKMSEKKKKKKKVEGGVVRSEEGELGERDREKAAVVFLGRAGKIRTRRTNGLTKVAEVGDTQSRGHVLHERTPRAGRWSSHVSVLFFFVPFCPTLPGSSFSLPFFFYSPTPCLLSSFVPFFSSLFFFFSFRPPFLTTVFFLLLFYPPPRTRFRLRRVSRANRRKTSGFRGRRSCASRGTGYRGERRAATNSFRSETVGREERVVS